MAINITGSAFASLFFDNSDVSGDQVGFLLGKIQRRVQNIISDSSIKHTRVEISIDVNSHLPVHDVARLFNRSGSVSMETLQQLIRDDETIVGWYQKRSNSILRPSMRDRTRHKNLLKSLPKVSPEQFLFCLCTDSSTSNLSTLSLEHVFYTSDRGCLKASPMSITNLGHTIHDYKLMPSSIGVSGVKQEFIDVFEDSSGVSLQATNMESMCQELCKQLQSLCSTVVSNENTVHQMEQQVRFLEMCRASKSEAQTLEPSNHSEGSDDEGVDDINNDFEGVDTSDLIDLEDEDVIQLVDVELDVSESLTNHGLELLDIYTGVSLQGATTDTSDTDDKLITTADTDQTKHRGVINENVNRDIFTDDNVKTDDLISDTNITDPVYISSDENVKSEPDVDSKFDNLKASVSAANALDALENMRHTGKGHKVMSNTTTKGTESSYNRYDVFNVKKDEFSFIETLIQDAKEKPNVENSRLTRNRTHVAEVKSENLTGGSSDVEGQIDNVVLGVKGGPVKNRSHSGPVRNKSQSGPVTNRPGNSPVKTRSESGPGKTKSESGPVKTRSHMVESSSYDSEDTKNHADTKSQSRAHHTRSDSHEGRSRIVETRSHIAETTDSNDDVDGGESRSCGDGKTGSNCDKIQDGADNTHVIESRSHNDKGRNGNKASHIAQTRSHIIETAINTPNRGKVPHAAENRSVTMVTNRVTRSRITDALSDSSHASSTGSRNHKN